ncbi:L-carnitine dehydratase/bile acid-inducible protein F [Parafrankia sp. EAN1pec]|uniref:CaiB/BaiF CoA transferase family protein n=1 Tax=Parafrankia sp. (strain EAN1pec) TaxID=298653 RepID=UPI0000544E22|nr:L-carnitine dehydratase/bile acid-inducible protein F [Frankia sp. EAN1pec]
MTAVPPTDAAAPPYRGLRVVEVAADVAGEFCTRLLGQMGAEVIKVEPPGGSPSRHAGPFVEGHSDGEHSLGFWHYNVGKRSAVLDLAEAAGLAGLRDLLRDADVFVFSGTPRAFRALGLDREALAEVNPGLVTLVITPFGLTGPWAEYQASDLISFAASGVLACCGYDDHTIPPIRPSGNHAHQTSATFGHTALLLALVRRQSTGRGDLIDLATHDTMAITVEMANTYWIYTGAILRRQTARHAQPVPTAQTLFECADGRYVVIVFIVAEQKPWSIFVEWLASHDLALDLSEERYLDPRVRQQEFGHIQEVLEIFFLTLDADTAFREGQERGLPIGTVFAPEEILDLEQLRERQYFDTIEVDGVANVVVPGPPYRLSGVAGQALSPPPRLAEYQADLVPGQV